MCINIWALHISNASKRSRNMQYTILGPHGIGKICDIWYEKKTFSWLHFTPEFVVLHLLSTYFEVDMSFANPQWTFLQNLFLLEILL